MYWVCPRCGFREELWRNYHWKCPNCSSPVDLEYEVYYDISSSRNIWERYRGLVPFIPRKTRGEGLTPLVEERYGPHRLLFKLEYLNPGGSFKDRGASLSLYYGHRLGYKIAVVDTSGNTGISVTLYSKLYGMDSVIVMPREAPIGKKKAIEVIGGRVIEAEGRVGASNVVYEYIKTRGVYYVAHLWNPLYYIGHATIAYEIYEEHGIPDYVVIPLGSGGLFLGLIHGFTQLRKLGLVEKTPKPIVVQGYTTQPVYESIYGVKAHGEESTLADGIMVVNPPRLHQIVDTLRQHQGEVVLVGNSEIRNAHRKLWETGFLVEPTSATVLAAYEKIKNKIPSNSSVLMILTGSGLKTL